MKKTLTGKHHLDANDVQALARKVYFALIEDIANIQGELVEIKALSEMFGEKALIPVKMLRNIGALANAPERMASYEKRLRERLDNDYRLAAYFEAAFAEKDEADMDALAEYIRERVKEKA